MGRDRIDPVVEMRAKLAAKESSPWAMEAEAAPSVFPVPLWAERMGLVGKLPDWMKNQNGEAIVDVSVALRRPIYNPDGTEVDQRDVCRQFWNTGKCKTADEGLMCFFKHERDPDVLARKAAKKAAKAKSNTVFVPEDEGRPTASKPVKDICRNFKFRGSCRFGDKCKYTHES
ncbi:hypothetical protein EDC01DRAFT_491998 [Geopyxis carbonaria]|nr:hypothetical protein EDC01DRAFT_491998 [Geopyxis carbonaria]